MAVASRGQPLGPGGRLARIVRFLAKASLAKLANVLTSFRMAVALPVAWLIYQGDDQLALILFILAALSDAFDGYIAKRFNACSTFGAILDPLADKLLVISALAALASRDLIPAWLVVLVLCRDAAIVAGGILLLRRFSDFSIKPLIIGKITTCAILVAIGVTLAAAAGWFAWPMPQWALHLSLAALIIASAASYLFAARDVWQQQAADPLA